MESDATLRATLEHYRTRVEKCRQNDLDAIKKVETSHHLEKTISDLSLGEKSNRDAEKLIKHLEPLVRIVFRISPGTPEVEAYIWGSIWILSKANTETFQKPDDVSRHDILELLYQCAAALPQNLDSSVDSISDTKTREQLIHMYCSFLDLCAEALRFFRDHQHDPFKKQDWDDVKTKASKTKEDIKTQVDNLPSSQTHPVIDVHLPPTYLERGRPIEAPLERLSLSKGDTSTYTNQLMRDLISQMQYAQQKPTAQPVDYLPRTLNHHFEGRSDDLKSLQEYLSDSQANNRFASVALHGLPGAGKTSLALQLANKCSIKNGGDFWPILWICAAEKDKIETDVCDIASRYQLLPEGISMSEKNIRAQKELMSWLQDTGHHWMVIFDNVSSVTDVREYLPPERPNCAFVVTTRDPSFGRLLKLESHRVEPLNVDQTADLIFSILNDREKTPENNEAAREIGAKLGGLPLAVTQIAFYILLADIELAEFLPLYRESSKEIHETDVELPDYQDTVANIWRLYKEKIDSKASILGEIIAFLQPDKIPLSFFTVGDERSARQTRPQLEPLLDKFEFLKAKRSLERGALLQSHAKDIHVHRLIQTVVLDSMSVEQFETRFEDTVYLVKGAFPKVTSPTLPNAYKSDMWHLAQECLPHVLTLRETFLRKFTHRSLSPSSSFPSLLSDTAWYLYEIGQFERCKNLLQTAEPVCEHDKPLRASTRSIRALIYHHQNLQKEAMQIWEENLEFRRAENESHFAVSNNLCNLAAAYGELGDMAKCREFFTRGQTHREKYNPDHLSDLALHDCNFTCYLIHYKYLDEAEETIARSLSRYKLCENTNGFGFNQALFFQAKLRTAQGRYGEALDLHTKVLDARMQIMSNHYYTCVSSYHTAQAADLCNDRPRAIELLVVSLKAFESVPEARNYVARSFFQLSLMYEKEGKGVDAAESLRKAQKILKDMKSSADGTCLEDYEASMTIRFR